MLAAIFLLNLTSCNGKEIRLCTGYCSFYADGGLYGYTEYTYEYDKDGNLVEECQYNNGNLYSTKEYEYDRSGSYTESEYDRDGNLKFRREYDKKGNLRTVSEYDKEELAEYCEYNEDGLIVFKESFKWSHYVVEYEYDGSGKLVKETETDDGVDGSSTTYESLYDAEGNRTQRTVTEPDGDSYIDFHAEIERDGNKCTIYQYRNDGELTFIVEKEYDDAGNVLKEVTTMMPDNEILDSLEYEYDSEGRVISLVESWENRETTYVYAEDGSLSSESIITYRWISSEAYGDGSDAVLTECKTTRIYDTEGNLTRINNLVEGNLESYTEYYYDNVNLKNGSKTSFDFREEGRELDQRVYIVY